MSTAFQSDAFQPNAWQILAGTAETPVEVPNVVGLTQEDGTTTLEAEGFVVVVSETFSPQPAGTIIEQNPSGGAFALPGSAVTILVSKGSASQRAGGRNYIIRGRKYRNLTNEELAYLLARELVDVQRTEVKVSYKGKKPHMVSKAQWASLEATLKGLEQFLAPPFDEDDEESAAMLLL